MIVISTMQLLMHMHMSLPLASMAGQLDAVGNDLEALAQSIQADANTVGITIFFISVIIAGIMRMIAFGSERRIHISNMALTAAVIGLVIMLLANTLLKVLTQYIK